MNIHKRYELAATLQGTYLSKFIFWNIKKQAPNFSDIYKEESVAYNKRGMFYQGFKLLNKAVELDPKEHLGYRGWMKLYKLKDYKGAISDFEKLNKISPDYANIMPGEDVNYLLAISYQGLGDFEKSKKYYERFFKENDQNRLNNTPYIYVNFGFLLEKMGDYKGAMLQYNESLKKGTYKYSESYYRKGNLFEKMAIKDSAKICYKKALLQYDKGYRVKDIYNEVFNEIYREEIQIKVK